MTESYRIIEIPPTCIDADLLYDLSVWLGNSGADQLSQRVEIERRNIINCNGYHTKFTDAELSKITLALLIHKLTDNGAPVDDYEQFGATISNIIEDHGEFVDREAEILGWEPIHDEPLDIYQALAGEQQIRQTDG